MYCVSIIMPAYNCSEFIQDAMQSVLNQSVTDLELIVIDDGSTDGTLEVINAIAGGDLRVKVFTQKNSGKPSIVRNRGLKLAKGEFIGFLDGDDLYCVNKLEESLRVFRSYPDVELVFHDVELVDTHGEKQNKSYLEAVGFSEEVLSRSRELSCKLYMCNWEKLFFFMCNKVTTIHTSSPLISRKRLFSENEFFPEELTIGEDVDLWFRLVKNGKVAFIDKLLSCYRVNLNSITHRPDRKLSDPVDTHIKNYKKRIDFFTAQQRKLYRKRIAADLYNASYNCNKQGRKKEALMFSVRSLFWAVDIAPIKEIVKAAMPSIRNNLPICK